jgi:hypothetical protein
MKIFLAALVILCTPMLAHAQGGACPTTAQYVDPLNLYGSKVTLGSADIGVTSCWYVAANGSDSNTGKDETHPFLHAPFMPNCTSTCATAQSGFAPGQGIILRGGDTWYYFNGTPLIGLPANWPGGVANSGGAYAWRPTVSGTASNLVYIGVDKGWFTGASWARPIISGGNATFKPSSPNFYDPTTTSVTSCAFPNKNLDYMAFTGTTYFIEDNIEWTGLCWDGVPSNSSQSGTQETDYIKHYQGGGTGSSPRYFFNNYAHGWSHTPFACPGISSYTIANKGTGYNIGDTGVILGSGESINAKYTVNTTVGVPPGPVATIVLNYAGTDYPGAPFPFTESTQATTGGGSGLTISVTNTSQIVCAGPGTFYGSTQNANTGAVFAFNVTDGSDSDDLTWGCNENDAWDYEANICRHIGGTSIYNNCHIAANNLYEHINNSNDGGTHADVHFCVTESPSNNLYYNNLLRFIGTDYTQNGLSTIFWFGGTGPGVLCGGVTCNDYIFNNVGHDVNCLTDCNNIGGPGNGLGNGGVTIFNVYNNTWQVNLIGGQYPPIWTNINAASTVFHDSNNHYITGAGTTCAAVYAVTTNVSCTNDLFQTQAVANGSGQGYTASNDYAPGFSTSATINAGTNYSSLISTFGTPFGSTTTGSVSLGANHTVVYPSVSPSNRANPTGAWNIGAWGGFGSGSVTLTPSSHSYNTTAVGSASSDSPLTFTITNTLVSNITITSVISSDAVDFPVTSNTCTTVTSGGGTCMGTTVSFQPTVAGNLSSTLTIGYSISGGGTGTLNASLSGVGTAPVSNTSACRACFAGNVRLNGAVLQ